MLKTLTEIITKCSNCGKETYWEPELGDVPLCVDCWDARAHIDNELAARQRRYYEEHKEEVAARQRRCLGILT